MSFLGQRGACVYILAYLAISKGHEKGCDLQHESMGVKWQEVSSSPFPVGWR